VRFFCSYITINYQLSIVNYQLTIINYQLTIINFPLSIIIYLMLKLILLKNFGNLDFCNYFVNTNTHMEISVISIGNSKGIRLSKTVLEKYNIQDSLELILEKNYIILKPKTSPRKGWDKAFKKMHEAADDQLLLPEVFTDEDFESWS